MITPRLSVLTTWQAATASTISGRVVVVIDVLRWSTVVLTAIEHGAERVEAFATADAARARAAELGRERVLLGGERGSVALPSFDVGNSPGEYTPERVKGRVVLTTTTNGTQALLAARGAVAVLIGAFVNVDAVVARLLGALEDRGAVTLLCAGQAGEETLEDTACAGAIADGLLTGQALAVADCDSETLRARALWLTQGRSAQQVMSDSAHARALEAAGFAPDVVAASQFSALGQVGHRAPDGAIIAR